MPSILFVCTANQFRSPLAAACLLKNIEEENTDGTWIVESAGTWTGAGMSALKITLSVANELGLDGLASHRTRQIDQSLLNQFDLILVMEIGHKEAISSEFPSVRGRVHLLSEMVADIAYDIPDLGGPAANPSDIGNEIQTLITQGKRKILELALAISKSQFS